MKLVDGTSICTSSSMVPEMMANRRVGSVFTSSIFTIGLIIIILVLLFNYSTLLNRNSEAIREAHKLRLELQHATLSNNDSVKKLEACKADVSTVETKTKKLENDMKKQETMLSDLREQIKQSRKLFDAAVEDKNGLSRRISDLENAKVSGITRLRWCLLVFISFLRAQNIN